MRARAVVAALACCLAALVPSSSEPADGDLDPSFAGTGVVTVPFAHDYQHVGGLALQADGKMVVAGTVDSEGSPPELALARYDAGGVLDPGFGSGGLVTTTALAGGRDVVVHPDGSIYVLRVDGDVRLARFTTSGDLDLGFGAGGVVTTDCGGTEEVGGGDFLLVQPDGKLLVAAYSSAAPYDTCVVRYHADGSLDATFGTAGIAALPGFVGTAGLALQADGAIVAGGLAVAAFPSPPRLAIARMRSDGTLDPAFGMGGVVGGDLLTPMAVAAQPDARVIVLTRASDDVDLTLLRYRADGKPDSTFGAGGAISHDLGGAAPGYDLFALAVQGDGKLVVGAGLIGGPGLPGFIEYDLTFIRMHNDGTLDAAYGTGGIAEPGVEARVQAMRVQPDGKLVAAGSPVVGSIGHGWRLARLLGFSVACPAAPAAGCKTTMAPKKAQLKVRAVAPASKKNQLLWKWKGAATTLGDFGDPLAGDDYALCLYDESDMTPALVSRSVVPGGGTCRGKPCWKALGTAGLGYADGRRLASGIGTIKLKAGDAGKASVQVKGQGAWLAPPDLPPALPLRVQLVGESGVCWEAVYSAASKNDGTQLKASSD